MVFFCNRLVSVWSVITVWIALYQKARAADQTCLDSARSVTQTNRKIKIIKHNWVSHEVWSHMIGIILEDVLNFEVEYVNLEQPTRVFEAVGTGDGDLSIEVWPSNKQAETQRWVAEEKKVLIKGVHAAESADGWYIPQYLASRAPFSETLTEFYTHLKQTIIIEEYAKYVIDPTANVFPSCQDAKYNCWPSMIYQPPACQSTSSCTRLLHPSPLYSEGMSESVIEQLGLNLSVGYFSTSELHSKIWESFADRKPVLFHWFTPSEGINGLSMDRFQRVELPPGTSSLDFSSVSLQKIISTRLESEALDAAWLVQHMVLTNDDYEQMFALYRGQRDYYSAACSWLQQNPDKWQSWVRASGRPYAFSELAACMVFLAVVSIVIFIHALCKELDVDGDGSLSFSELKAMGAGALWRNVAHTLGLPYKVVTMASKGPTNPRGRQILSYNNKALSGLGGVVPFEGTVLREHFLLVMVMMSCLIICCAVLCTLSLGWFGYLPSWDIDTSSTDSIAGNISGLMNFLLGLYVSIHVGNWWTMRDSCIGGLWGAMCDSCVILGSIIQSPRAQTAERREALVAATSNILRKYLASHQLLYQQARGENDLEALLQSGILLEREVEQMRGKPSLSQLVLCWANDDVTYLHQDGHLDEDPHSAALIRHRLSQLLVQARGAEGKAFAFLDCQLPFIYVHLLSYLVKIFLIVQASAVGIKLAVATAWVGKSGHASQYVTEPVKVIINTLFYQGLLDICEMLRNPFKHYGSSFPNADYHGFMENECTEFARIKKVCDIKEAPFQDAILLELVGRMKLASGGTFMLKHASARSFGTQQSNMSHPDSDGNRGSVQSAISGNPDTGKTLDIGRSGEIKTSLESLDENVLPGIPVYISEH